LRIDVGCEYKDYCSDVSRTVAIWKQRKEKRKIIRAATRYAVTIKLLKQVAQSKTYSIMRTEDEDTAQIAENSYELLTRLEREIEI